MTITAACSGASVSEGVGGPRAAAAPRVETPVSEPDRAAATAPVIAATSEPRACARRRPGTGAARGEAVRQGSTVALARSGSTSIAYVADEDDDAVHTFDVGAGTELAVTPLAGSPSQLLVLADGRVAVALRDRNRVVIMEPAERADAPLDELCSAAVAVEPVGLAATPDEARLVVTSGWGHALTALSTGDLATAFRVDLPREPRAVLVDDDGRRAFVSHIVGARISTVDLLAADHPIHAVPLRFNVAGCQGYALARAVLGKAPADADGPAPARIFAPMVSVNPGDNRQSFGYGGSLERASEVAIVGVVDSVSERMLTRAAASDGTARRGECLLPRAAAMGSPDGLLVACAGADSLIELDARAQDPASAERRRWSLPSGPSGIAVDAAGQRAVVWSQFAHEISVVDLGAPRAAKKLGDNERPAVRIAAARKQSSRMTDEQNRGRELFHSTSDARISRDGRACASCHPDGREDALTWSTPDGPRQTIMLAGRIPGTEPYGWFGTNKTLRAHVTRTFQRLGGTGLADKDKPAFDALLAYLGTMRGPSLDGAPADDARARLVERGRSLFMEPTQGCTTCHLGNATDKTAHDVKSGNIDERSLRFDTPSLRFVSGTAPYFHDGRFRTLEEVLEQSEGTMGHTIHLTRPDLLSLVAYLETL